MTQIIKQIPPEEGVELMGLEKHGMSVFPGVESNFEIPMRNGRYYVGQDNPKYEQKIAKFEEQLGFKFDSDTGQDWLESFNITLSHDVSALDPNVLADAFTLHILEINDGYGIVALNEEAIANAAINTFKFAVTSDEAEINKRVSKKQIKTTAFTILNELYDGNSSRIITIAKYLLNFNGTSTDRMGAFDKLHDFIDSSVSNAEKFVQSTKLDMEYILTVVKVKDAIAKNIISLSKDGFYYNRMSNTKYGRTESEAIDFLLKPINIHELGEGLEDDLPYSISAQLKVLGY